MLSSKFIYPLLGVRQPNYPRRDSIFVEFEEADGTRQVEALRAGAAWIEKQCAAPVVRVGLVTVPEDDHIGHMFFDEPGLCRAHLLDGRKLVTHEDGSLIDDGQTLSWKAHRIGVIVTAHGDDGRDSFETPNQLFVADVARVDDATDAREEIENLFVESTVCV